MKNLLAALLLMPSVAIGSGIYNPGSTGGGGSGGFALPPATVTIMAAQGVTLPDNTTLSTGAINLSQMANLANANLLINGNFTFWNSSATLSSPAPGATAADGWVVADNTQTASYTISREASIINAALYSMKTNITSASLNGRLWIKQNIQNYLELAGSSVTATAVLYAVNNSPGPSVALAIQDSVSGSTTSTVAVDSTWHSVNVTHFIPSNATSLSVWVGMPLNNPLATGAFYVDNVMLVKGDTPVSYVPRPLAMEAIAIGSSQTLNTASFTTTSNTFQTTNLSASIIPPTTNARVKITVIGAASVNPTLGTALFVSLFRGSTNLAVSANAAFVICTADSATAPTRCNTSITFIDTPATTSSTTYTVKIKNDDNSTTVSFGAISDTLMNLEIVP